MECALGDASVLTRRSSRRAYCRSPAARAVNDSTARCGQVQRPDSTTLVIFGVARCRPCPPPRATGEFFTAADDVHGHARPLFAAAVDDAADRADVGVVAAPRQRHVAVDGHAIVGRVGVDPADVRHVERDPGVRGVDADEAGLVGRRRRFEIAAHVARRQAERAQAGDLQVGEVLADAAALPEDLGDRRRDRGRPGRELEVLVQAVREIDQAVDDGAAGRERRGGVGGVGRAGRDQRRVDDEIEDLDRQGVDAVAHRLPRRRPRRQRRRRRDVHRGPGRHGQAAVRSLHREERDRVAEDVLVLAQHRGRRVERPGVRERRLTARAARRQAGDVVRHRHALLVVELGDVRDVVDHRRRDQLTRDTAWLK